MGEVKPVLLTEDTTELSAKDLEQKLKKLEGYVKKTQSRIKTHEKAINKLQEALKKELTKADAAVKQMKKIKVSV